MCVCVYSFLWGRFRWQRMIIELNACSFRLSCASLAYSDIAEGTARVRTDWMKLQGRIWLQERKQNWRKRACKQGEKSLPDLKLNHAPQNQSCFSSTRRTQDLHSHLLRPSSLMFFVFRLSELISALYLSTFQDGTTTIMPLQPPWWAQETFCDEDPSKKNRWQP